MSNTAAKATSALMVSCLIYLAFYFGNRAAEPTRKIMDNLRTQSANGELVIDHCANRDS